MTEQHSRVVLEESAIQELASLLRGRLLRPSDEGYEQARQVFNGMINKHPALIVRCVDVADVMAAVNFAREHQLTLAVRGGGHSGPGLGTCDDGSGDRPLRYEECARRSHGTYSSCRGRLYLRRCGSCHPLLSDWLFRVALCQQLALVG